MHALTDQQNSGFNLHNSLEGLHTLPDYLNLGFKMEA